MEIKELCQKASENARNKGFWDIADFIKNTEVNYCDGVTKRCYDCRKKPPRDGCYYAGKLTKVWQSNCLMQIVAEASEALEVLRRGNDEAHAEEIADMFIRLGDYCGNMGIDIEPVIKAKMEKNLSRGMVHGKLF